MHIVTQPSNAKRFALHSCTCTWTHCRYKIKYRNKRPENTDSIVSNKMQKYSEDQPCASLSQEAPTSLGSKHWHSERVQGANWENLEADTKGCCTFTLDFWFWFNSIVCQFNQKNLTLTNRSASTGPPTLQCKLGGSHSENSEIGHLSCFIEFFAFFHIVSDRYTSD